MESQDKEKEYEDNVWEIYRKEWETASPEKKIELNKRMRSWQELMKSRLTAQQAYIRVMEGESEKSPIYTLIEEKSDIKVAEEPSDKLPRHSLWEKTSKALSVILGLALVVAIVYCVVITGDRNALNTELESVQSVLTSTQSELSSTKQSLALTQADLSSTKQTLASTQSDLTNTKQTLASTQSDLTNTKQTLASTQQQLAVAQETLGGLGITLSASKECFDVALIDNPTATNPTWSQLMTFLSQDQTEQHTYIKNVYDCSQFSRDVHNNAEARGIRVAVVQVKFRNELVGHALNAFITTNRGLVYVDCTGVTEIKASQIAFYERFYGYTIELDNIAYVKAGKEYGVIGINDVFISPEYSYYENYGGILSWWKPIGIVESIEIYW